MNYDLFLHRYFFSFALFVEPLGLPLPRFAVELPVAAGGGGTVCADEEGRVLAALDVDVAFGGTREDAVAGLPRFAVELPVAAGGGGTVSAAADVEGRASVALQVDKSSARVDAEAGFFFVSVRPEVDFCL